MFDPAFEERKVRQDDMGLYGHHLLNSSISVNRFSDVQSELLDDIAQESSHVSVVFDHQHQFAFMIVWDGHHVLTFIS